MLEAYEAYGDYDTVATLTRELIQNAAVAVYGATYPSRMRDAQVSRCPVRLRLSLRATGTPASGPGS